MPGSTTPTRTSWMPAAGLGQASSISTVSSKASLQDRGQKRSIPRRVGIRCNASFTTGANRLDFDDVTLMKTAVSKLDSIGLSRHCPHWYNSCKPYFIARRCHLFGSCVVFLFFSLIFKCLTTGSVAEAVGAQNSLQLLGCVACDRSDGRNSFAGCQIRFKKWLGDCCTMT